MIGQNIFDELNKTLIRYRAGIIDLQRCRQELSLLVAMMRAYEDTVLEEKLERIQSVMEERR
jgi:hypothetical protein